MRRGDAVRGLVVLGALILAAPSVAGGTETYSYTVHHPSFGEIGTYTDRIERGDDGWRVDTTVHIAVRTLGMVVHREDAERTEIWHQGRLTRFDGVTTTNGKRVEIHGAAQPDGFVVQSPTGAAVGPADTVPSDPWQAARSGAAGAAGVMMSTKSGRLERVQGSGSEPATLSVGGHDVAVRHFTFSTNKRQDVWLDARGVPIRFRSVEDGTPIDFVLSPAQVAASLP
jgi:hypothetical protein